MNRQKKEDVVSQATPSIVPSIAEAIVIKDDNLFCISHRDGSIPLRGPHGFGLFYNDCRYLSGYAMRLGDMRAHTLVSNASREYVSVFQLTNEEFTGLDGKVVRKEQLGVKWRRVINFAELVLYDTYTFQNFGLEPASFEATFDFDAGFEDIFMVRGFVRRSAGALHDPEWDANTLCFRYDGEDKMYRSLSIRHFPAPTEKRETQSRYRLDLGPRESREVALAFCVQESMDKTQTATTNFPTDLSGLETRMERTARRWLTQEAKVETNSLALNRAMLRSFRDLRVLESSLDSRRYFAAGIPWFATLFGRDSLITALQTLSYNQTIAEEILRILADHQGKKVDAWKDESPGKILHELRFGELARLGEIPHTPYYGTIDATPLFLVLLSRHAQWTGDLSLFQELEGAVEGALSWMENYGLLGDDPYLKYESTSTRGLSNQGWKDSWDGIVNDDGSLATAPIALVEVQGYMYEAKLGMAELFDRSGNRERAAKLRAEAHSLRETFNRDYWVESAGCYAIALQKDNRPVASVSSNAGHALWSGIADADKAKRVCRRLMEEDMFSGWGIRTLSTRESRYNPLGYHLGTVWPHDNVMIAAGFKRYGFEKAALAVFQGLFEATTYFDNQRLPELFSGYSKSDYEVPVHYPVACHPQAWAAGTIPYFLQILLGLVPEAFSQRLRIVRPALPELVDRLEFRDLRVGEAKVDLGFYRTARGSVAVEILNQEGPLEVVVEPEARVQSEAP